MPLELEPMGTMIVHIGDTWNFQNGPIAGRSCSVLREIVIDSPQLRARSIWSNGTYVNGPSVAEANIRALFRSDDGAMLYLDYLSRLHLPTHVNGASPAILSGRFEVADDHPRYAWLNRTHITGHGILDTVAKTQSYHAFVLRFPEDHGPKRVQPEVARP